MRVFLCLAVFALAGQSAFAQTPKPGHDASNLVGSWIGEWSTVRSGGRLEFDIASFDGERMTGRFNSEARPTTCSIGWTPLTGKLVGSEIHGTYTIGPPCGRVDIIFPFPRGDVIEGRWTSEYPGYGPLRLTKQTPK